MLPRVRPALQPSCILAAPLKQAADWQQAAAMIVQQLSYAVCASAVCWSKHSRNSERLAFCQSGGHLLHPHHEGSDHI